MKNLTANPTLADALDQNTVVGSASLWQREDDGIRCFACGHRCLIGEGKRGICKVRYHEAGQLRVPFGYVAGVQCDPVEKKPFFHLYPGSDALTFGMMGCDLHCSYCQNWVTSQAPAMPPRWRQRTISAAQLVEVAQRERARLVVSSYNEPLITAEWAVAVFEQAKKAGLACAFVSNGNATPEVLDFLRPWIVAYKVDLKSFDDHHYRSLGGTLANITDSIRMVHERGIWLEVVTLVIPGFNDSEAELRQMAKFLASVSRDIPWHVTAFHKDYRMTEPDATSPETLVRAAQIGAEAGLRFVYAGNLPGRVGPWENTNCPSCGETLIERRGYMIRSYRVSREGRCPLCGSVLPGIWPRRPGEVRTGNDPGADSPRVPRAVALPLVDPPAPPPPARPSTESDLHQQGNPPMAIQSVTPEMSRLASLELTASQKQQLFGAVGALVRAIAQGKQTFFDDSFIGGLGSHLVAGTFVSLKYAASICVVRHAGPTDPTPHRPHGSGDVHSAG